MTIRPKIQFLATVGLLSAALHTSVHAEGIAAGTLIENTAQATYTVGGVARTTPSNTVVITVDEILDVAVASLDAGNVALSAGGAVLTFQVTNAGNGPEAFILAADAALAGDDFDPLVTLLAIDSDGNGVYDNSVDALVGPSGLTPELAADQTLRVFAVMAFGSSLPADADVGDVRLRATAATGSGTPGTVFASGGAGGTDAVVGSTTAIDSDVGRLIAQLSAVTLAKSALVVDPFGGDQAVPGAFVTYRLVASVEGSAAISNLEVNDAIPNGTSYVPGSLTLNSANLTDVADADAGTASSGSISVMIPTAPGGSDQTITFRVQIDN